jgi:molybdopterin-guanine dinucleotide biosynthesis protein A
VTPFDAVILAGGSGRRLGGVDKAAITIGGSTLLDRTLDAVEAAGAVVCVGPERALRDPGRSVVWTREQPPGGGPVAGLSAGLDRIDASVVAVLAVDHPFVAAEAVSRLIETCALADVDAALAEDEAGVAQPLLAAYRTAALRVCLRAAGSPAGVSMSSAIEGLRCVTVPAPESAQDCDTPEDLERARRRSLPDRRG